MSMKKLIKVKIILIPKWFQNYRIYSNIIPANIEDFPWCAEILR